MANRMICFGYKMANGTLCVAEEEAAVVTEIFQRYGAGEVMKDIADDLTRRGVAFSPEKSVWNKPMLARMLENRKYIGEYVYNRSYEKDMYGKRNHHKNKPESEIIRIPDGMPRIIDDETFFKVQAIMDERKERRKVYYAHGKYLFAGLMKCGHCGGSVCGGVRYNHRKGLHLLSELSGRR